MQKLEALRLLQSKLASIEQDHEAELAGNEALREEVDARAEARALTAVLDYLQECKIAPSDSLLRLFRRYLRGAKDRGQVLDHRAAQRSRAG
jgi:hypothetical protein